MINFLISLLFGIIAVEAVTEIIVDSKLFFGFRSWLYPKSDGKGIFGRTINSARLFIFSLLNCGYCTSVWVSAVVSYLTLDIYNFDHMATLPLWIRWLGITFVIHRLSNWFHVVYEYVRKGRVLTVDVTHRQDAGIQSLEREEQSE